MTLRMHRDGPVAWLVLDRPDSGNAIDMALAMALADTARAVAADSAVRCVVLTGSGRLFCAGGDIAAFAAAGNARGTFLRQLADALHAAIAVLATMPKPLMVVVNGPAAGAGMSLALLGDIVLASETAHFTAAYSAVGLSPDGGMSWLLPRLAGLRRAQEIILTNRRIGGEEAAAIGLVTRVTASDLLTEESKAMARTLAAAPIAALGAARRLLLDGDNRTLVEHLDAEAAAIAVAGNGPEAHEGIAAFLARRPPDFTRGNAISDVAIAEAR